MQPLCGMETFSRETIRSIFALDYPAYEIIFCLASEDDPIAPVVRGAIDANPDRPARLLVGDDRVSANPKLNNVVKGWKAARHEWIIMADSNVLMPRDYIQRLLARLATQGRHRLCAADRLAPRVFSPPKSNVRSSIPIRRAGNMRANPRIRFCPGQDDAVATLSP